MTSRLNNNDLASSVTPSVRVFFFAKRRKMYREPVIKRRLLIRKLLDTIFLKSTRSDDLFTRYIMASSVARQFECFAAQRRKMYREPVIKRRLLICKLLDTVFFKNLLEVTFRLYYNAFASSVARQFECFSPLCEEKCIENP
ncbi:hypothetical protein CHRY9390_00489 [Chryseobacterium aquaeductus]|uniref:Uncharacterized protein n=1 Tax=Chryseobacterium aquaeductus TaxID=2675056 RepID=A0A9N8MFR6_9FLAO|nr:hypothetical protein CHRY9390_00489 [Chryseobacterium potabilaquae]CAD7799457.1 hypothetical protein CHRY9390_00489 [Chryseobacterium aquaeductus]